MNEYSSRYFENKHIDLEIKHITGVLVLSLTLTNRKFMIQSNAE